MNNHLFAIQGVKAFGYNDVEARFSTPDVPAFRHLSGPSVSG
jgi:hypothetical protein